MSDTVSYVPVVLFMWSDCLAFKASTASTSKKPLSISLLKDHPVSWASHGIHKFVRRSSAHSPPLAPTLRLSIAGSALAVGISCANTGMQSALDLLEPLQADSVDFVRQGALIATSLVLMQQPEPKVGWMSCTLQILSWADVTKGKWPYFLIAERCVSLTLFLSLILPLIVQHSVEWKVYSPVLMLL